MCRFWGILGHFDGRAVPESMDELEFWGFENTLNALKAVLHVIRRITGCDSKMGSLYKEGDFWGI